MGRDKQLPAVVVTMDATARALQAEGVPTSGRPWTYTTVQRVERTLRLGHRGRRCPRRAAGAGVTGADQRSAPILTDARPAAGQAALADRVPAAEVTAAHVWSAISLHLAKDPIRFLNVGILDLEPFVTIEFGCWRCPQPFTVELAGRGCAGKP